MSFYLPPIPNDIRELPPLPFPGLEYIQQICCNKCSNNCMGKCCNKCSKSKCTKKKSKCCKKSCNKCCLKDCDFCYPPLEPIIQPIIEPIIQPPIEPIIQPIIQETRSEGVKISRTDSQTIPNNQTTLVSFNIEIYDTCNMFSTQSPTSIIITHIGYYIIGASIHWQNSGTMDTRILSILLNGCPMASQSELSVDSTGNDTYMSISTTGLLSKGDVLQLQVFQQSGKDLSLITSPIPPTFWVQSISLISGHK